METKVLTEAFTDCNYITVAVYVNGEYDRREKISKNLFPSNFEFYSGQTINI